MSLEKHRHPAELAVAEYRCNVDGDRLRITPFDKEAARRAVDAFLSSLADDPQTAERVREIAEPLFTEAVAHGMHSPFPLDAEKWGTDYASRLLGRLLRRSTGVREGTMMDSAPPLSGLRVVEEERLLVEAAEQIAALMEKTGVSRAELARRLGKTRGFVTQILSGERNLTLRTLAGIAWALDHRIALVTAQPEPEPQGEGHEQNPSVGPS